MGRSAFARVAPRLTGVAMVAAIVAAGVFLVMDGDGGEERAPMPSGDPGDGLQIDTAGWKTDFSKRSVPLEEFMSSGPPRDGIPPIDRPKFTSIEKADSFLAAREPVIALRLQGEARAYPLQIMTWHEIVNDRFGDRPVGVTFCPLCNSSVVFDRRVDGRTLRFGTTGKLRKSDLVMWDEKTESWWQQLGAEAIVGKLTGTKLRVLPSQILSWGDFKRRFSEGKVLSRDTGFTRSYGENPYEGYDDVDSPPFALDERDLDRRLPPKLRVSAATVKGETVVYPFDELAKRRVINDEIKGVPVVVAFKRGVSSALDEVDISAGRDVGTSGTFVRRIGDMTLEFEPARNGRFRDRQTRSVWDISGRALSGQLEGRELRPVRHDSQFWFAIAAFFPKVEVFDG
jgi:Protein of unknown function (DUF3179)